MTKITPVLVTPAMALNQRHRRCWRCTCILLMLMLGVDSSSDGSTSSSSTRDLTSVQHAADSPPSSPPSSPPANIGGSPSSPPPSPPADGGGSPSSAPPPSPDAGSPPPAGSGSSSSPPPAGSGSSSSPPPAGSGSSSSPPPAGSGSSSSPPPAGSGSSSSPPPPSPASESSSPAPPGAVSAGPGFKLDWSATPADSSLASLRACLAASKVPATFKAADSTQNSDAWQKLQAFNAQARGAKLMPVAFAEPTTTEEVAAAVKCAGDAGLPFAARNGGHSYEAASLLDQGVVIDLRALADIHINVKWRILTVGGGQRVGAIYSALAPYDYVLPASTCVGVGISGITLGGGLGHATRNNGFLADSVLAATVVLANGTVVEANSTSNPDLFWAVRGGGPLYGIVTRWRFKVQPAPPKVAVFKYKFQDGCTEAKFAEVLTAYNSWKPWELPKEFSFVEVQCGYGSLYGQTWFFGSLAEVNSTMMASPLFKLSGVTIESAKEYSYIDFILRVVTNLRGSEAWGINDLSLRSMLQAQDRGSFVAGSFIGLAPMDDKQVATMAKYMAAVQQHAFIQCRAWGAQVAAVPNDFNAFPWRSAPFECQLYSSSGTAKDRVWLDSLLDELHSLTGQTAAYYNYFHCVKDPWETYFGPHAERLKQIKQAYDPLGRMSGGLNCQFSVVLTK